MHSSGILSFQHVGRKKRDRGIRYKYMQFIKCFRCKIMLCYNMFVIVAAIRAKDVLIAST